VVGIVCAVSQGPRLPPPHLPLPVVLLLHGDALVRAVRNHADLHHQEHPRWPASWGELFKIRPSNPSPPLLCWRGCAAGG
jgi:hypothetical protein